MYQQQAPPPPPPAAAPIYHQQQMQMQQQPMMAPSQAVDPGLIQQVMSLTPQQIAQLPAEKQQYLLQLRQQFAQSQGGAGGGR
jgi:cleavage stimulation factor subunit 2